MHIPKRKNNNNLWLQSLKHGIMLDVNVAITLLSMEKYANMHICSVKYDFISAPLDTICLASKPNKLLVNRVCVLKVL